MPIKKIISYLLVITVSIALFYCFYHKGIRAPVKNILHLTESTRRLGDFWSNFPGPFVDKYNPELRDKTAVKLWYKGPVWGYGPIQHLITLPLTFMRSIKLVSAVWLLCNYAFLAAALLLLLRLFKDISVTAKIVITSLWLGYWPLLIAIQEDVIEIFELFLIIVSLHFLYKKKDIWAGVAMGVASMAKFLPIIFLPYFLIKGKFKAFLAMFITVFFIAIAAQFTLGWQNNDTIQLFLRENLGAENYFTYWRSQTISSAIERIFSTSDYSANQIYYPVAARPLLVKTIMKVIVPGLILAVFSMIYMRRKERNYGLDFSILSLLMFLVASHGHPYYLVFCLIGYAFGVYYIIKGRHRFGGVILGISYFLSGYIMQMREFDRMLMSDYTNVNREVFFLFLSFPAYGAALLFVLLCVFYLKKFDA